MTILHTTLQWAVYRPKYGYLINASGGCLEYSKAPGMLYWPTFEQAKSLCTLEDERPLRVMVTVYNCEHETQMAFTVGHGVNKGKWVAVCAKCGEKSRGRPKSTEEIAHASLTRHPAIGETMVKPYFFRGELP